jgi:hypothetical protein
MFVEEPGYAPNQYEVRSQEHTRKTFVTNLDDGPLLADGSASQRSKHCGGASRRDCVAIGKSRHFAALQNLVAIGSLADIEQAASSKLDL